MEKAAKSGSIEHLPRALATTLAVVGVPTLAVFLLSESGAVTALVPLLALGMTLSLATSQLGAVLWAGRRGGGDVVFGDLMLWGWLRRWHQERQLSSALRLLGLRREDGEPAPGLNLDQKRRARLLEQLAAALEARDPGTFGHSRRVARHAVGIARRMGLSKQEVDRLRRAAAMHDVGKIEVPVELIDRPGPLNEAEYDIVKQHPVVGAELVAGLGDPELVEIVRHHHERLDGGGYPDGLVGEEIPLGARIVAVADTFDAVTSARPYRPARPHREALALLAAEAGTQLDPDVVRAFRGYYSGLRPILFWAFTLNGARALLATTLGELRLGRLTMGAKVLAATALTIGAGDVAGHSLHGGGSAGSTAPVRAKPAPATTTVAATGDTTLPQRSGGASGTGGTRRQASAGGGAGEVPGVPPSSFDPAPGEVSPTSTSSDGAESGAAGDGAAGDTADEAEPASSAAASTPATTTGPARTAATTPEVPAAPASSTVGTVTEAVESGVVNVPVSVPGVPEVQVKVPGLPTITVGGG